MRLFTDVASSIDDQYLARAWALAERGRGTTSPNPMVGCVIVADGTVVGEGFHERAGGPHAEVIALRQAGKAARGATAYVTLEPCNHYGLTPPCSAALVDAGIRAVIIGMSDPHELAAGGAAALMSAGVLVAYSEDPTPFIELNEAWIHRVLTRRPYVHVKVALSLDGHSTAAKDRRTMVSSPGSGALTMRMRASADAVLVGAETARIDDPMLTVRDRAGHPAERQPLRVVLGRSGVPDAALFHDGLGGSRALVPEAAEVPAGVVALRYDATGDPATDLRSAMAMLADEGITRLFVEAGPKLFSALWGADLIDELSLIHAGGVMGAGAPRAFLGEGEVGSDMEHVWLERRFSAFEAGVVDGDAVTCWKPRAGQGAAARPEGESE